MTLVLNLTPEQLDRLESEAAQRGVSAEEWARSLLEDHLAGRSTPGRAERPFYETATPEEWEREFDDFLASFSDVKVPDYSNEAFRREYIYEDRL